MIQKIVSILYALVEAVKKMKTEQKKEKLRKEMKHRDDRETIDNLGDILR